MFKQSTSIHLVLHSSFSLQIVQQLALIEQVRGFLWEKLTKSLANRLVVVLVQ
jgi:hypothetical protein